MSSPSTTKSDLQTSGGLAALTTLVIFQTLCTIAIGIRILGKFKTHRKFEAHDWLIFVGYIFTWATVTQVTTTGVPGALGLHVNEATPEQLTQLLKSYFIAEFIWMVGVTFNKLSFLHLYICVFNTKWLKKACYIIGVITIIFCISLVITPFVVCHPLAYNWNHELHGHCGNIFAQQVAGVVGNTALDLSIVLLPLPILWKLQMTLTRKLSLMVMFSLGLFICVVSLLRLPFEIIADPADFSYSDVGIAIFAFLENQVGVIAACGPFVAQFWTSKRKTGSTDRSSAMRTLRFSFMSRLFRGSGSASSSSNGRSRTRLPAATAGANDALPLQTFDIKKGNAIGVTVWAAAQHGNHSETDGDSLEQAQLSGINVATEVKIDREMV